MIPKDSSEPIEPNLQRDLIDWSQSRTPIDATRIAQAVQIRHAYRRQRQRTMVGLGAVSLMILVGVFLNSFFTSSLPTRLAQVSPEDSGLNHRSIERELADVQVEIEAATYMLDFFKSQHEGDTAIAAAVERGNSLKRLATQGRQAREWLVAYESTSP